MDVGRCPGGRADIPNAIRSGAETSEPGDARAAFGAKQSAIPSSRGRALARALEGCVLPLLYGRR